MPKAKKDPTAELYKNAMSHALWVENEIDCLRREGAKESLKHLPAGSQSWPTGRRCHETSPGRHPHCPGRCRPGPLRNRSRLSSRQLSSRRISSPSRSIIRRQSSITPIRAS